jgi:hypothetical protein
MGEDRLSIDFDHAFGLVVGERAKSCAFACCEYNGLHISMGKGLG